MPDICDLILDDHAVFRRRFAELDELRAQGAEPATLDGVWTPLAGMLERHAAAEEEILYPKLLVRGDNPDEETDDAIRDHNDIRDAIKRALKAEPGSGAWWDAVLAAREDNSDHMAEEEREPLPDFRLHTAADLRERLGAQWLDYAATHAGGKAVSLDDEDPKRYISEHRGG